ncbi:hypothetical protein OS493_028238 [Desmophyllum pertusum]|uniref:Transmembrane protein 198 n=1 Tax=Desmophyllum pertusum TaxID=174260 RepID=A0A9W9YYH6_9CNID|nr:hypothetical protein OS493_028238 [Desmophyllum pertusum]
MDLEDEGLNLTKQATQKILDKLVYNKHPATVTVIEILAVTGIVVWAAGYRLIRTQLCCGPNGKEIAHVLFSALVGVFGGFLGCRLYRLGVFTIGECLGLIVGLTILSTPLYKYFHSNIAYAALMATISLMFGSLAHFYEKPVVIIATACAGSLAVLYAIPMFVCWGVSTAVGLAIQYKITANNLNSSSSLLQFCNCCDRPRPDR